MTRRGVPAHRGKRVSEADFRRLWQDRQLTLRQIGVILGISESAVHYRGRRRGLPPRGVSKPTLLAICGAREAEFRAMWQGNVASQDIAAHFGVSDNTVPNTAARLGLPQRGVRWRGVGIGIAEWREARVAQAMAADAERTRLAMIDAGMHSRNRPTAWVAA